MREGALHRICWLSMVMMVVTAGWVQADSQLGADTVTASNRFEQISTTQTNALKGKVTVGRTDGSMAPDTQLEIDSGNLRMSDGYGVILSDTDSGGENWFFYSDAEDFVLEEKEHTNEVFRIEDVSGSGNDQYRFFFKGQSDASTSWVAILQTGSMGVGTTNTSAKLHVDGDARFDDGIDYTTAGGDISMGSYTNVNQ